MAFIQLNKQYDNNYWLIQLMINHLLFVASRS